MNECILAVCITLFSDFGAGYGAEVSNDLLYARVQQLQGVTAITQGVDISHGQLAAHIGFGSLYQDNDTMGLNFIEAELKYTLKNGIYARALQLGDKQQLSIGISTTF